MPFPKKPEVMSPAGHWPQLNAAIESGADAFYFGLKHFSARAKVGFELSGLPEAMRTLHRRGVRLRSIATEHHASPISEKFFSPP